MAAPSGTQSQALDTEHVVWVEDINPAGERVRVGYEGPLKLVTVTSDAGIRTALYDLGADATEEHPADDHNRIRLNLVCPLILKRDVAILVDTGIGNRLSNVERKIFDHGDGWLIDGLKLLGAVERPVNTAPVAVVDPEREWKLRALGYIR